MDRVTIYPGAIPLETDLLNTNKNTMIAISKLAAAMLGVSTIANGFAVTPTGPASLQVVAAAGELYSLQNIDGTAYSSIAADTSHQIVKQGISLDPVTLSCAAPGTTGQSINYLVQATYQDLDAIPVVLPYYNASNPSQAYSGPNNTGTAQYTQRKGTVTVQAKAGVSATTGSQTTPAPDAGYVGLYVVTVAFGQTTITSTSISQYSAAPLLPSGLLQSIQNGNTSFAVDTGTANTYVCNFTPAIAARIEGQVLRFKVKTANNGACTINDGLGVVSLVGGAHTGLQGGELVANGDAWVQWNTSVGGGAYILLFCTGAPEQVAPATQSQHAAQWGQVVNSSAARVSGLLGKNNSTTPNTQFDFSALSVTCRNPTTGAAAVSTNTSTITTNVALAGPVANGRDQAAAFTASQWIYFYFIWNPTTSTLATIASTALPPAGPALPAGYTHWAYIGAVYFGSGSTLALGNFKGSWFNYQTAQLVITNGSSTTLSATAIPSFVPLPSVSLEMELAIPNLVINSTAGGGYSLTCNISVEAGASTTMQIGLQGGGLGSTTFGAAGTAKRLANLSQGFNYQLLATIGTAQAVSISVCGYNNANGGEG